MAYDYDQSLIVLDEGTRLGAFNSMNFVGASVAVTNVNGVATVTISGGGSVTLGNKSFFVSKQGNDATAVRGDLSKPYLTINAANNAAIASVPGVANVCNIVVYPGTYVENFSLQTCVNLIGAEPTPTYYENKPIADIVNKNGGPFGNVYIQGTITQTGEIVHIVGVNCDTLHINFNNNVKSSYAHMVVTTSIDTTGVIAGSGGNYYDVHCPSMLPNIKILSTSTMVNCVGGNRSFSSNVLGVGTPKDIEGTLINCRAGSYSFASTADIGIDAANITATALLINCSATDTSFASSDTGLGGNILGVLRGCVANDLSFSSSSTGTAGAISGSLYDCIGAASCYASATTGDAGSITGNLYNCVGTDICFCSSSTGTGGQIGSGTDELCNLFNCTAGNFSFSSSDSGNAGNIKTSAILFNCRVLPGSSVSFASSGSGVGGTIQGTLNNCYGYYVAFACSNNAQAGVIDGMAILNDCYAFDVAYASGGTATADAGQILGRLYNCCGGTFSFASAEIINFGSGGLIGSAAVLKNCYHVNSGFGYCYATDLSGIIAGTLDSCEFNETIGLSKSVVSGRLVRCRIKCTDAAAPAVYAQNNAVFVYCDINPNAASTGIDSDTGGPINIDARFCSFYGTGISGNCTLLTATPYNTDDVNSIF